MTDNGNDDVGALILLLEEAEETRDGIQMLLNADGYRIDPARNEQEALAKGRRQRPDLILVSAGGFGAGAVSVASRVRDCAELGQNVPVVIFCVETIAEGAEVEVARNLYVTRPDNFDQLRALLHRLLDQPPAAL